MCLGHGFHWPVKNEGKMPESLPKGKFSDPRPPVLNQDWSSESLGMVTKGNKNSAGSAEIREEGPGGQSPVDPLFTSLKE